MSARIISEMAFRDFCVSAGFPAMKAIFSLMGPIPWYRFFEKAQIDSILDLESDEKTVVQFPTHPQRARDILRRMFGLPRGSGFVDKFRCWGCLFRLVWELWVAASTRLSILVMMD